MSWTLGGNAIRAPNLFEEIADVINPVVVSLDNTRKMDVFGSQKKTWNLGYDVIDDVAYNVIKAEFDNQIATGDTRLFMVTERSISATVIIVMELRDFRPATNFLSDFSFKLIEV